MNKNEILLELKKLNVRCEVTLECYVDYCIEHNQHNRIFGETAHHHILPKAKTLPFYQFSDLKINEWNGVHLKYYNHYYAHWLLFKSLNESSMAYAFFKMHKNSSNLFNEEPISEEIYYDLYTKTYIVWNKGLTGAQVGWTKGLPKEQHPNFGKPITEEHKLKISKANSGDNNYWRNNPMTDEHKLKNSEANKKVIKTPEWNKKNSEKRTGTKLMNNSVISQYVQPEDIESRLLNGWKFGKNKNILN